MNQKSTFGALQQKVRACRLCEAELPLPPGPIFQLQPEAKILIAGQAPGLRTQKRGIPFADPSGRRLRQWLGVDEETFYDGSALAILPMAFCYPGKGRSGDLPPPPRCAENWREGLLQQLPNIRLTLVLGQYAQRWHLPQHPYANLTELVRHWRDYWPQIMPLPHPSPRNIAWFKRNPWFEQEAVPQLQQRVTALLAGAL